LWRSITLPINSLGCAYLSWDQFGTNLELFRFAPVRAWVDPTRISREQHLHTMAELLGNEGGVHARHTAYCRIGVTTVVWLSTKDVQRFGCCNPLLRRSVV